MKKYVKLLNEAMVQIFCGTDIQWAKNNGFEEKNVEKGYDGNWYLEGKTPLEPEKTYTEKRLAEYPAIGEQLDMIYWDKVNGTNLWQKAILSIKEKYPKA